MALSPDKKVLAVGGFPLASDVALISLETGKVLDTFTCAPDLLICYKVFFSPDGRTLVTNTCAVNSNDQPVEPVLKLWKLPASW